MALKRTAFQGNGTDTPAIENGRVTLGAAIGYLLLAFPLGLVYFVVLVTFLCLSLSLSFIWIGLPIFVLELYLIWQWSNFERHLAMRWLHCTIPPFTLARQERRSWLQFIRQCLTNKMTWKGLLFLILKFPLGMISFVLVVQIVVLMPVLYLVIFLLGFFCVPFLYLTIALRNAPIVVRWWTPEPMYLNGMKDLTRELLRGFGLLRFLLYVVVGMAWLWKQLARALLGMNMRDMRLAQAEELVRHEQARSARAELSRQQLIVNVSHELRTPVASIQAHLEALLRICAQKDLTQLSMEELSNYLGIAHREAVRLGSLVEDLLSLASTDADAPRLNMAAVHPGEVIEEVYQTLLPLARKERLITLLRSLPPAMPMVLADRQRLVQVLMNLVRNAITYTPDGGIISLSTQQEHDDIFVVSVADTGIGIPSNQLQHIFERFYRTDASRSRSSGGFGLGLSIVNDLVEAMGGKVTVESQVGVGSCFSLHLQVAQVATVATQDTSSAHVPEKE
jgi:signal transduction histidine kinase